MLDDARNLPAPDLSSPASSLPAPSVIERLACPACLGALALEDQRLRCLSCGRAYPVVDGIPVLIADRAIDPANEPG